MLEVKRSFEPCFNRSSACRSSIYNCDHAYYHTTQKRNEGRVLRYPYTQMPGNIAAKLNAKIRGINAERRMAFLRQHWIRNWERYRSISTGGRR